MQSLLKTAFNASREDLNSRCILNISEKKPTKFRIVSFLLFTHFFLCHAVFCQTEERLIPEIVMPAPNVAALNKFTDIPVSFYTGTPQISVPIYSISQGELKIDIGLSYHSSGIKVDDQASWVGLGWTLNAGGNISRVVRGIPDESFHGFLNRGYQINSIPYSLEYLKSVTINTTDAESDQYYINAPGLSGNFTFNYEGELLLEDYSGIKIASPFNSNANYWKIVSEEGVQYIFGKHLNENFGQNDTTTMSNESSADLTYVSAWHLQKMISSDKQDTVYFTYGKSENIGNFGTKSYNYSEFICNSAVDQTASSVSPTSYTFSKQKLLTQIKTRNLTLIFVPSTNFREDINTAHTLDSIKLITNDGAIKKKTKLHYSYFGNNQNNKRLKLTRVSFLNAISEVVNESKFEYNENFVMPAKGSLAQDHWGYFNSNQANTLIPKIIETESGQFYEYTPGGNRDSDSLRSLTYLINKITYPTGGYSVLTFESNKAAKEGNESLFILKPNSLNYSSVSGQNLTPYYFTLSSGYTTRILFSCSCSGAIEKAAASITLKRDGVTLYTTNCGGNSAQSSLNSLEYLQPGNYSIHLYSEYESVTMQSSATASIIYYSYEPAHSGVIVGGARIKQISNFDVDNRLVESTEFDYTYQDQGIQKSSGVLLAKPIYYSTAQVLKPLNEKIVITCYGIAYNSAPSFSIEPGSHIGYKQVLVRKKTTLNQVQGYTIYNYTTAEDYPDVIPKGAPFVPGLNNKSKRGLLVKSSVFDNNNKRLSETINEYTFEQSHYKKESESLKIAKKISRPQSYLTSLELEPLNHYIWSKYKFRQSWSYLKSTIEKQFNETDSVVLIKDYVYGRPNNHTKLTETITTNSFGSKRVEKYKYTLDYDLTLLPVLGKLVQNNIIAIIENQNWTQTGNVWYYINGRINFFDSTYFKKAEVWESNFNGIKNFLNTENMNVSGKYINIVSDSSVFQKRAVFLFNENGKVKVQKTVNNVDNAYLWGYKNSVPIAEVIGDTLNGNIYFENFEENGNNSITSKTGKRSNTSGLFGQIKTLSNLKKGEYVLTYWRYENNKWLLVKKNVTVGSNGTVSLPISINEHIDDVRFHPKNATMTTYTYDVAYGITSITDANNEITYFSYDKIGRLKSILNSSKKITKNYNYQYIH